MYAEVFLIVTLRWETIELIDTHFAGMESLEKNTRRQCLDDNLHL
jgi:hypothetical protein